jgi:hypothetical protein
MKEMGNTIPSYKTTMLKKDFFDTSRLRKKSELAEPLISGQSTEKTPPVNIIILIIID